MEYPDIPTALLASIPIMDPIESGAIGAARSLKKQA